MLTEEFDVVSLLGRGSYGEVHKAVHRQNGRVCAVKVLTSELTPASYERVKKEISIMVECNHRNIVKCFGSQSNQHGVCLFLEYCAGGIAAVSVGSIKDVLKASPGLKLTEEHIASILQRTLLGLEYLHQRKTIHRDIKAGNILINEMGEVKLSDFGVSTELLHTLADKDTLIGSPFWMSPEVLSKNKYNCKTDIWSLGITAIELAQEDPPYSHLHPIRAMFAIQNKPPRGLSQPERWSREFNEFVKKCLQYEPTQRPSAKDLLSDRFIVNKATGEHLLQSLVNNCVEQLEKNRRELQSTMGSVAAGSSIANCNGTMIQHQGKVEQYQPFWEGHEDKLDSNDEMPGCDGTMVVKEVSPPRKEADFVAYYREQQAEEERKQHEDLKERHSIGPTDRPKIKEVKIQPQQKVQPPVDAQLMLNQLIQQMNIDIEEVKNRYLPQIDYFTQLLAQQQKHQKVSLSPQPSKKVDDNACRKLKSTSNDVVAGNKTQPLNLQQVRKTEPDPHEHKKTGTFGTDSFVGTTPNRQLEAPKPKKTRFLETQMFEEALHQLKENKKNAEEDGSYFTSFLKKGKKQPGLKQNAQGNLDEFSRTQKLELGKIDRHQYVATKPSRK